MILAARSPHAMQNARSGFWLKGVYMAFGKIVFVSVTLMSGHDLQNKI